MTTPQELIAAIQTLKNLGYTWLGGELWKPPLGAALAQQGEPVAWTLQSELEFLATGRASATMFSFTEPDQTFIPLYTAAPQAQPVAAQGGESLISRLRHVGDDHIGEVCMVCHEAADMLEAALQSTQPAQPLPKSWHLVGYYHKTEAADVLQSQAERIKELESDEAHLYSVNSSLAKTNETLRAQLAEIEKTEPVAWLYTAHDGSVQAFTNEPPQRLKELCKPLFNRAIAPALRHQMSDGALIDAVANSIAEATRPMPAQDVGELVEALEKLLEWCEQFRVCGDAGNWDWREGDEYSNAFAALSKYKGAK